MDFSDNEDFLVIQEKAKEYEVIFEEIQNYDLPEQALDRIEGVLEENISLKQENLQIHKELEEMEETIKAQNFKSNFESLKKRPSYTTEYSSTLTPEIPFDSPQLSQILSSNPIQVLKPINSFPPPPPPPKPSPVPSSISSKSKYRPLFWQKAEEVSGSIFEDPQLFKIRENSLSKFPMTASKTAIPPCKPIKAKVLDYNREILVTSAIRSLCMPVESFFKKLQSSPNLVLDSVEIVKSLSRIIPTPEESKSLNDLIQSGVKLSQSESFLFSLSKLNFLPTYIDCALFKFSFSETWSNLKTCFEDWKKLCVKLRSNKRLQVFMQILLSFGNELNQNNVKCGQAKGFHISILNSIPGIKSSVDSCTLLEVLIEEFFNNTGNPHIFHKSEHLLLKEIAHCSFASLMESYEEFYKDFCKFSSVEFDETCSKFIKSFVRGRSKDIEELIQVMNETKEEIRQVHRYFIEKEETDDEGKFVLFRELALFYDKYIETVNKKWAGVSNRDSKRFTRVPEISIKSK